MLVHNTFDEPEYLVLLWTCLANYEIRVPFAERVPEWLIIKNYRKNNTTESNLIRFQTMVSIAHKMKSLHNGRCAVDQGDDRLWNS